jgi:hypothetical protein
MPDSYLAISAIASDQFMTERMNAAATQQSHLGSVGLDSAPLVWVSENRYLWAASPTWGEKWTYALDSHPDDPDYQPGKDDAVITDADILATVQELGGPGLLVQQANEAPAATREDNTQAAVDAENAAAGV